MAPDGNVIQDIESSTSAPSTDLSKSQIFFSVIMIESFPDSNHSSANLSGTQRFFLVVMNEPFPASDHPPANLSKGQTFSSTVTNETMLNSNHAPSPESGGEGVLESGVAAPEATSPSVAGASLQPRTLEWTLEQDDMLCWLRRSGVEWKRFIGAFPGRGPRDCRHRYFEILLAKIKELPPYLSEWTQEEEDLLFELRNNECSWSEVADMLPLRTAAACRSHYFDIVVRRQPKPGLIPWFANATGS